MKYSDLAERIHAETRDSVYLDEVREVLEWLDRNPDQVPGRTIAESEFHEAADAHRNGGIDWEDLAFRFGITVVPDPETTNAEKLANDLQEWGMLRGTALSLAPWLVGQGWVTDD